MAGEGEVNAARGPADEANPPESGDPLGGPRRVTLTPGFLLDMITKPLGPLAVVSGATVFCFLAASYMTPTMGARRSVRLKWQERKARARVEAEAAVREAEERKP